MTRPVVLFRDQENGDYLMARQSPSAGVPYESLREGDPVDPGGWEDGHEWKKAVRRSREELQIFCECPPRVQPKVKSTRR